MFARSHGCFYGEVPLGDLTASASVGILGKTVIGFYGEVPLGDLTAQCERAATPQSQGFYGEVPLGDLTVLPTRRTVQLRENASTERSRWGT